MFDVELEMQLAQANFDCEKYKGDLSVICEKYSLLETENERLKAEREEANSWDDSWKMAEQITQLEKCLEPPFV